MQTRTWKLTEPGIVIIAATGVLLAVGLACIYVTDTHYASGNDGPANAKKQFIFIIISLVAAMVVLRVGYHSISRYAYIIFGIVLVLLFPLAIARGFHMSFGGLTAPRNGAYRWINLPGYQLQPSELMKAAYLISLAWYLRYRSNYRHLGGLFWPFAISVVPFALILIEPDLGTVLLLVPVLFVMLFLAGAKIFHLLLIALMGLAMMPLAWGQIKSYQRLRVAAVLLQNDELRQAVIDRPQDYELLATKRQAMEWAASSGYQLVHSKNAVGSGGWFGYGWGGGIYVNHSLLPDRHNDFVFSLIGHQWGFVGCSVVLCCYIVIVTAGVRIASVTKDPFGRLLAVGAVTLLAAQMLINVGMTIGLLPITGMTLPFVSYGGSSLLSNFVVLALLISVSQHRPFLLAGKPFDFRRRTIVDRIDIMSG